MMPNGAQSLTMERPVLIYGAGAKGRQIAGLLQDLGYPLLGFADRRGGPTLVHHGLPIRTLEQWLQAQDPAALTLVVAIHNHQVAVGELLADFSARGLCHLVTPVELHTRFADRLPPHYWLTSAAYYQAQSAAFAFLRAFFTDPASRDLLERIIEFRLTGNYGCLPAPDCAGQYCPTDLPPWPAPLRLIDCGAFDGDTLRQFAQRGYRFAAIAAFEPDLAHFSTLARMAAAFGPATCFPCGVDAATRVVNFMASGDMASQISTAGDTTITCVAIDEALPGFAPTLLKMDVEGAELAALRGAERTIRSHRPGLAISLYHRPADLWEIPRLLESWRLGYDYYLRCHGHNTFDLVLYGRPRHG